MKLERIIGLITGLVLMAGSTFIQGCAGGRLKVISEDKPWIHGKVVGKVSLPGRPLMLKIIGDNQKIYNLELGEPKGYPFQSPDFIFQFLDIGDRVKFIGYQNVNIERFPKGKGVIPSDEIFLE